MDLFSRMNIYNRLPFGVEKTLDAYLAGIPLPHMHTLQMKFRIRK